MKKLLSLILVILPFSFIFSQDDIEVSSNPLAEGGVIITIILLTALLILLILHHIL